MRREPPPPNDPPLLGRPFDRHTHLPGFRAGDENAPRVLLQDSFPDSAEVNEGTLVYRPDLLTWYGWDGTVWKPLGSVSQAVQISVSGAGTTFPVVWDTPFPIGTVPKVVATPEDGWLVSVATSDITKDGCNVVLGAAPGATARAIHLVAHGWPGGIGGVPGGATDHGQLTGLSDDDHLQYMTFGAGLDAAKPAAGRTGRVYFATDTGILYRDTGAAWLEVARGETFTRLAQLSEKAYSSLTSRAHGAADHTGDVIPAANQDFGAYYSDFGQIAAPANPGAGVRRLFVNSADGKVSVRTSAGTTVSLEEQGGTTAHDLGGALHNADTIANLNAKVSDADLAPTPHLLGGAHHSADTLANLNAKISDGPVVKLAGQLGGTAALPDVRGLRETSGPTLLTLGAVADGQYIKRSGATAVGGTPAGTGDQAIQRFRQAARAHVGIWPDNLTTVSMLGNYLVAVPIYIPDDRTITELSFEVTSTLAGSNARIGLYTSSGCYPAALLRDSSDISTATAGRKVFDMADYAAGPNALYWLALHCSGNIGVAAYIGHVMIGLIGSPLTGSFIAASFYRIYAVYGALPNPFTAGAAALTGDISPALATHFA